MKTQLEFVEHYLYEKPDESKCRYFRGMSVYFKGNLIFNVHLTTGERNAVLYRQPEPELNWLHIVLNGLLPNYLFVGNANSSPSEEVEYPLVSQTYFKLEDIELCKQECYAVLDRYVKFLTE